MKQKFLILLLGIVLSSLTLPAQILQSVKWNFTTEQITDTEVNLVFKANIDKDWHLYSQHFEEGGPIRLSFAFEESDNYKLIGEVEEITKAKSEFDEIFGIDIQYFVTEAILKQKVKLLTDKAFTIAGEMEYQTCREGECVMYTPDFDFKINKNSSPVKAELKEDTSSLNSKSKESKGLWTIFIAAFVGGLLAIVTPCVFPMIPMTVSYFMHSSENKTKGRIQAFFYGASIIAIYTVIGTILAVVMGPGFANFLSTHWVPNIFFFLIFVFFAFSFFGMFEITMPSWMVNKSVSKEDKGGFMGSFFMAFTLVLVSFSCTGPIVGSILVASAGGEVLMPIIGMLGFSLAFAMPFTLFAIFPGWLSKMPKSGGWLNSVKVVLGFLELALGLKFLSIADQTYHWGILDREIYLAIWIVIFTLLGFYLLGKLMFSHDSPVKHVSVPRLMLAIASFSFVVYMFPGMFGAPLKALSGYIPPQATHDFDLNKIIRNNSNGLVGAEANTVHKAKYSDFLHLPHGLTGYFDYDEGMAAAKKLNKPVFIDFTGHGCVNCREMEANVWSDPRVLKIMREDYVIIALYVDDKKKLPEEDWVVSAYDGKMKKTLGKINADFQISKFGINAQPYYVLQDKDKANLVEPRAYDLNVDAFVEFLEKGKKEFLTR